MTCFTQIEFTLLQRIHLPSYSLSLQLMISKPEFAKLCAQSAVAEGGQVPFTRIPIRDSAVLLYNAAEPLRLQLLLNVL